VAQGACTDFSGMPDEEPTEIIKAVAEGSAKGTIDALLRPFTAFLGRLLGPATEELGGWAGEAVAVRRERWRARVLGRAEGYLLESGQDVHPVPRPVLWPILEAAADEEDEAMSDRWAALLANAAAWPARVPPSFPWTLSQLSPQEAGLLDAIFGDAGGADRPVKVMELETPLDPERRAVAVDNLIRLRLCVPQQLTTPGMVAQNWQIVYLTALGRAFVTECRAPTDRP
jgi:hypothetical protein